MAERESPDDTTDETMVFFTVRALATLLQRGPTAIRFGLRQPVFLRSVAGPVAGKATIKVLPRMSERITAVGFGILNKAGTNIAVDAALEITGGDEVVANAILGRTITPISKGRILNVTDAGEVIIGQVQALRPGGEAPDFRLFGLGLASLTLPFVGEEVIESIVEQLAGPGTKIGSTISSIFKITKSIF